MKRIVLIPSYEPDDKLIELIDKLIKEDVSIIVIDDGSGENYKNIFEQIINKVKFISYAQNRGKGYALKTGLKYIKDNFKEEYIVVTMDSDGQHRVEDAMKLCGYIEQNPQKLVLGKRPRGKNTPLRSKIGNGITKVIYRMSTGVKIYDTQTGLRAFSNVLIDRLIEIEGDRYEYEMNVLLVLPKEGVDIKEIEIKTIYIDNNSKSHFNTFKDSIRIYKQIIKFSLASLSSFVIDYISYTLLTLLTQNIVLSNIVARVISGTANFTMNKKLVFKHKGSTYKSASQYFLLAITILALNTSILYVFVNICGWNAYASKILVETVLFIFSWIVQNRIIFINRRRYESEKK